MKIVLYLMLSAVLSWLITRGIALVTTTTLYVALTFLIVWAILIGIASITFVKTGEIGVVFRFKKFVRVSQPGLNFVIPLIESIEYYSTQTHQDELPDESDKIDRIHDIPDPGKRLPFRVLMKGMNEAIFYVRKAPDNTTIDPNRPITEWNQVHFQDLDDTKKKALEDDSLHAPLTGEIAVVVEWYLKGNDRKSIEDFVQNVIPEGGRTREDEVRKRIEDMAARSLQEFLGPVTLGHAQEMMQLFSQLIKDRVEILVGEQTEVGTTADKPWGIQIRDAYIKSIHPGRRVNEARADAAAAVSQKQGVIRDAEGKAEATRVQATADAFSEEQKGKGEATRIREMAAVMVDDNARFVATLDVAETVLPKANTIIMPSDLGVIGGILTLGREIARNNRKESDPADKK